MPRSSGKKAMPWRAITFDESPMSSWPSWRTDPVRCPTIPMIDLSVVVLPAPLRPSRVTTSPPATSNAAPCRICDSPYQAWRSRTDSSEAPGAPSGMAGPQIRPHDVRMLRHGGVVALGENLAAREHGDVIRERRHDREVVLDHEHRAVGGDLLDQRRDPFHVFVRHARRRLVEQHHLRVERERGRDLERTL